jgi:fibrillarin-like pre-rRNA processing protein
MQELFFGVYTKEKFLYTLNLVPRMSVYGERIIKEGEKEFRAWDPYRSKLSGAIRKGMKTWPFKKDSKILYLGASAGTTISHLSDICIKGEIYSIEISPHIMNKLIQIAEKRENIAPILGDARKPQEYEEIGKVDIIYQDVAQPDQAEILVKNSRMFLKPKGIAMIAIKSQSIDVLVEPQKIFEKVLEELSEEFELLEKMKLEPFDKDHMFAVLRRK